MKLIKIKNGVYYIKLDGMDTPIKLSKYIYEKWSEYVPKEKLTPLEN